MPTDDRERPCRKQRPDSDLVIHEKAISTSECFKMQLAQSSELVQRLASLFELCAYICNNLHVITPEIYTFGTVLKCPDYQVVPFFRCLNFLNKVVWDLEIVSCLSSCPYFRGPRHFHGIGNGYSS